MSAVHPAFSLVDGGPLCRLIRRLGWVRPDGRCARGDSARRLAPLIKPLPDFDEEVLGYQQPAAPH